MSHDLVTDLVRAGYPALVILGATFVALGAVTIGRELWNRVCSSALQFIGASTLFVAGFIVNRVMLFRTTLDVIVQEDGDVLVAASITMTIGLAGMIKIATGDRVSFVTAGLYAALVWAGCIIATIKGLI